MTVLSLSNSHVIKTEIDWGIVNILRKLSEKYHTTCIGSRYYTIWGPNLDTVRILIPRISEFEHFKEWLAKNGVNVYFKKKIIDKDCHWWPSEIEIIVSDNNEELVWLKLKYLD